MVIRSFPPLEFADRTGLIAVGGDFEVESLLLAYRSGIFPWPTSDYPLAWFAPPRRAILSFADYRPSRSFYRWLKKTTFTISIDTAFSRTMEACALAHMEPGEDPASSTWITPEMIAAYTNLHYAGYAHSVEVWDAGELVGGIYGISIGAMFAAESMFYIRDNASKLALYSLIGHLKSQGVSWIDVQVINPFTASLGANEVTRNKFMGLLGEALKMPNLEFRAG